MRCARSMETTTRDSEISFTVLVFGTSTSMPDCKIGAVIMKMTRRTSMTSTKGTILMSDREVPVWRVSCGIFVYLWNPKNKILNTEYTEKTICLLRELFFSLSPVAFLRVLCIKAFEFRLPGSRPIAGIQFFHQRGNFHGETIHARAQVLDVVQKVVVSDHGGNRGE